MEYVVLLTLLLRGTQLIIGVCHLYSFFIWWCGVIRVLLCVLWSLHSWRSRWSSREGVKRYQNGWSTDTLGGLSEHVSQICLFHWWSFFPVKATLLILGLLSSSVRLSGFANYWPFMLNYRNFAIHWGVKIWLQQFMAIAPDGDGWSVSWPSHFTTDVGHWTRCCGGSTAMLDTVSCQESNLVLWLSSPQPSHYIKLVPVPQHSWWKEFSFCWMVMGQYMNIIKIVYPHVWWNKS